MKKDADVFSIIILKKASHTPSNILIKPGIHNIWKNYLQNLQQLNIGMRYYLKSYHNESNR